MPSSTRMRVQTRCRKHGKGHASASSGSTLMPSLRSTRRSRFTLASCSCPAWHRTASSGYSVSYCCGTLKQSCAAPLVAAVATPLPWSTTTRPWTRGVLTVPWRSIVAHGRREQAIGSRPIQLALARAFDRLRRTGKAHGRSCGMCAVRLTTSAGAQLAGRHRSVEAAFSFIERIHTFSIFMACRRPTCIRLQALTCVAVRASCGCAHHVRHVCQAQTQYCPALTRATEHGSTHSAREHIQCARSRSHSQRVRQHIGERTQGPPDPAP